MHLVCPCHLVGLLVRHTWPLPRLLVRYLSPNLSLNCPAHSLPPVNSEWEDATSLLNCCLRLFFSSQPSNLCCLHSKMKEWWRGFAKQNSFRQSVVLTPSVKSCTKLAIFSSLLAAACSSKLQIINIIEKAPGVRMLTQTNLQNWMPPPYCSKNNDTFYQISIGFASPGIVNTHP